VLNPNIIAKAYEELGILGDSRDPGEVLEHFMREMEGLRADREEFVGGIYEGARR
jgi:hypothetical protein